MSEIACFRQLAEEGCTPVPAIFRPANGEPARHNLCEQGDRLGEVVSPKSSYRSGRLLQRRLLRTGIVAWRHGDDSVLAVFVVQVFYAQDHLVLLHVELRLFTHGQ
jgi:hypothetical protein